MVRFASRSDKGYEIILDYMHRCLDLAPRIHRLLPRDRSVALIADRCILKSFNFSGMHDGHHGITRAHRSVVDAHRSTFDWIFNSTEPGFVKWLEQDSGIFWINGKAGAGKSTFMKFLFEDARLKHHLCHGSPDSQLLLAEFFFWSSGSYEQKSQIGLLKTILYRIFSERQDLMRAVYKYEWMAIYDIAEEKKAQLDADRLKTRDLFNRERPGKLQSEIMRAVELNWTRPNLLRGLNTMLAEASVTSQVFLLIDGLDEYEGTEEELEDLVEILKSCASLPNIKICVSTRPWTVFERKFGNDTYPSFRLQDLTSNDIALFVSETFEKSELMQTLRQANPERMPDFYSSIVQKAEGVFLWVRLVVKSISKGLQNGDELSDLQSRVDELPADLESLYRHMLDRIPERYWERSSRMFSIVHDAREPPLALTLWYAGERGYKLPEEIEESTKLARCYQVYLRLTSQCAGLLEVRSYNEKILPRTEDCCPNLTKLDDTWSFSSKQHYVRSNVHYLHRTTKDFLDTPKIAALLRDRLRGSTFDSHSWLAVHATVDLAETAARIRRSGSRSEDDFWDMYGFEYTGKIKILAYYLERSPNIEVSNRLTRLINSKVSKSIALLGQDGWVNCQLTEILKLIDS